MIKLHVRSLLQCLAEVEPKAVQQAVPGDAALIAVLSEAESVRFGLAAEGGCWAAREQHL